MIHYGWGGKVNIYRTGEKRVMKEKDFFLSD